MMLQSPTLDQHGKYIQFYYMQCNQDYENKIESGIICQDLGVPTELSGEIEEKELEIKKFHEQNQVYQNIEELQRL